MDQDIPPVDDGRPAQEIADDHFRCDHAGTMRLTLFTASNRTTHYRMQCSRCGDHAAVRKDAATQTPSIPFDSHLAADWSRRRYECGRDIHVARREALRRKSLEHFRDGEAEFLESPRWAEMRRLVMRRAGGICEGCLTAPAVQVHHLNYDRRFSREMLFDLRAVCRSCHVAIHDPSDLRNPVSKPPVGSNGFHGHENNGGGKP